MSNVWFHGVGALPLRPDSRSDGKSGGLRPRPDAQLAKLAEPVPIVPEMLTGGCTFNQHSADLGQATALSNIEDTNLLLKRKKQANIKSNGVVFHASDTNCVAKPLIGVHKIGAHRSYPIPVRPPVVPNLKPKPPERTTSESSLSGSKKVTTPSVTPEPKADPPETNTIQSSQPYKNKPVLTSSEPKRTSPQESAVSCVEPASTPEAAGVKPTIEEAKTNEAQFRSLASPSPRSSQLSLYVASVNYRETRRNSSPAPQVPPLITNKTSQQNLIPPEEKENRRSPSPLQPSQSQQSSRYFLPIQKSPLKEITGKKSPVPDHFPTGKKSPLPECVAKNLVRKSSSRTSIPEVHEISPSPSKPIKECLCADSRRTASTPARPKSVAFAIDDKESRVPPPPPPPRGVSKPLAVPTGISKANSCPGIIYSPRKDILIVKQPLAIIKPSVSPVQTIGIRSTPSGKIVITEGGEFEAEVVSVITAGGEVLSVVCEKQKGGSEVCGGCVKTGGGNFCVIDGDVGRFGPGSDFNTSLASLAGSSGRRSSVTSLSGSSLASLVVGSCCGGSEFEGLIIGDDIVVMGASGGAGAGAKGASGGSEAESCGGGACRKILSGRNHQQQATSTGQTLKPQQQQFQQPKGGGAPGPGPGGGGGTQVRVDSLYHCGCSERYEELFRCHWISCFYCRNTNNSGINS